jgi:REP element-mobilizing transposase RayT
MNNQNRPVRKQIRLKDHDYRKGSYFVTIITKFRKHHFGRIIEGEMKPYLVGEFARKAWLTIPDVYPNVTLDEFIVMPDHIHGILHLTKPDNNYVVNEYAKPVSKSLGTILGQYKGTVTKRCKKNNRPDFAWHRLYYDIIIKEEQQLNAFRQYIIENPMRWTEKHGR